MKTYKLIITTYIIILTSYIIMTSDNILDNIILMLTLVLLVTTIIIYDISNKRLNRKYNAIEQERDKLLTSSLMLERENKERNKECAEYKRKYYDSVVKVPFAEPIKQCECGSDMIKRNKYWVCSSCKKRKLIKEEE